MMLIDQHGNFSAIYFFWYYHREKSAVFRMFQIRKLYYNALVPVILLFHKAKLARTLILFLCKIVSFTHGQTNAYTVFTPMMTVREKRFL